MCQACLESEKLDNHVRLLITETVCLTSKHRMNHERGCQIYEPFFVFPLKGGKR